MRRIRRLATASCRRATSRIGSGAEQRRLGVCELGRKLIHIVTGCEDDDAKLFCAA